MAQISFSTLYIFFSSKRKMFIPYLEAYKKVKSSLKTFGFTEFREGQQEATARVISGILSTQDDLSSFW